MTAPNTFSEYSQKLISESQTIGLDARSKKLRRMVVEAMIGGGRGHVGSSFSLIEILRALYDDFLKFDAKNPLWPERDRCILSKGHGCLALYAFLADKGFISEDILPTFCKPDSILGGHPERGKVAGVEASTGSLGHGLSIGVGMALGARIDKRASRVVVILGDGESNEGSVWEAAMSASKHGLDNLVVLTDYNKQQSYATTTEVLNLEPLPEKWRAFGFDVHEVNGHDYSQLKATLAQVPFSAGKPSAIICHTVKGKGVPGVEANLQWHHKNKFSTEDVETLMSALE